MRPAGGRIGADGLLRAHLDDPGGVGQELVSLLGRLGTPFRLRRELTDLREELAWSSELDEPVARAVDEDGRPLLPAGLWGEMAVHLPDRELRDHLNAYFLYDPFATAFAPVVRHEEGAAAAVAALGRSDWVEIAVIHGDDELRDAINGFFETLDEEGEEGEEALPEVPKPDARTRSPDRGRTAAARRRRSSPPNHEHEGMG